MVSPNLYEFFISDVNVWNNTRNMQIFNIKTLQLEYMQMILLNGLFNSGRNILTLECDFILQLENKKITIVFKLPTSIKFWM
jgi:hypothetical protein